MARKPNVPKRGFPKFDRVNIFLCAAFVLCLSAAMVFGLGDSNVRADELGLESSNTSSPLTAPAEIKTVNLWRAARPSNEEEAISSSDDLLELARSIGPKAMDSSDLSRLGNLLMKRNEYDEAATYFEALITFHPDSAAVRYAWDPLIRCYKEMGNRQAERDTYRRLLDFSIEGSWLHEYALEGLGTS